METTLSRRALLGSAMAGLSTWGRAQGTDLTRIVVPFPPGGVQDIIGRALAEQMRHDVGLMVIENRPGANMNIAAAQVARAPADGKQILYASDTLVTVNPSLYKTNLQADLAELEPLSMISQNALLLVVPAGGKITTMKDFIAEARSRTMDYASGGVGTLGHLVMAYMGAELGLKLNHIPYNGGFPTIAAIQGGQVEVGFLTLPNVLELVKVGRLKALAVSSARRAPQLPDVPTVVELGYKQLETETTTLMMIRRGTSAEFKARWSKAFDRALASSSVQSLLARIGVDPAPMTPAQTLDWLARNRRRWADVIERHKITQE